MNNAAAPAPLTAVPAAALPLPQAIAVPQVQAIVAMQTLPPPSAASQGQLATPMLHPPAPPGTPLPLQNALHLPAMLPMPIIQLLVAVPHQQNIPQLISITAQPNDQLLIIGQHHQRLLQNLVQPPPDNVAAMQMLFVQQQLITHDQQLAMQLQVAPLMPPLQSALLSNANQLLHLPITYVQHPPVQAPNLAMPLFVQQFQGPGQYGHIQQLDPYMLQPIGQQQQFFWAGQHSPVLTQPQPLQFIIQPALQVLLA